MSDAHYRRLPGSDGFQVFESTIGTASNWDSSIQHGSPPLALLNRAGDSQLARIAHRLIRKEPDDRFQTAEEVYEALSE